MLSPTLGTVQTIPLLENLDILLKSALFLANEVWSLLNYLFKKIKSLLCAKNCAESAENGQSKEQWCGPSLVKVVQHGRRMERQHHGCRPTSGLARAPDLVGTRVSPRRLESD